MGLDIDRLIGYGDDFGMTYPRRMFKIGINKLKKRGKLPKHPHKGFRAGMKNAMVKHPPYLKSQWDDDVDEVFNEEQDFDWYHDETGSNDLPDFSYPDYKPNFGLKDRLGDVGSEDEFGSDPAWGKVVDQKAIEIRK
ncbi:uncharacterized protein LOC128999234 isoform X2 [Macrosteles quadrilineatus]|uniref:uncharacterized protein LOC128999234 isoform X2 n=1 Tax=Macrosteles quadrilineatus TaxID=74068 RepID=UPI0023E293B7|nr:uncharacterized protein LOC128999234 isoform X2 [Macrosteles quadrilineatus]